MSWSAAEYSGESDGGIVVFLNLAERWWGHLDDAAHDEAIPPAAFSRINLLRPRIVDTLLPVATHGLYKWKEIVAVVDHSSIPLDHPITAA